MQENENHQGSPEYLPSTDAVRLLWEGTRKALDGGVDHDDLVSLCDIVVRLADHRLLFIQAKCDGSSAESQAAADQLRRYRALASSLLQWAAKPAPEPDWDGIAERLESVGADPLGRESQPKE